MSDPMTKLAMSLLEKKLRSMPQADAESMLRELRDSEKAETEIGRAMIEMLERHVSRDD